MLVRRWPRSRCGGGIHSVVPSLRFRVFQPLSLTRRLSGPQARVRLSMSVSAVGPVLGGVVHLAPVDGDVAAGVGAAAFGGVAARRTQHIPPRPVQGGGDGRADAVQQVPGRHGDGVRPGQADQRPASVRGAVDVLRLVALAPTAAWSARGSRNDRDLVVLPGRAPIVAHTTAAEFRGCAGRSGRLFLRSLDGADGAPEFAGDLAGMPECRH